MKKILFSLGTVLLLSSAAFAQSTVDSIAAKYKLQPMPEPLTIERTFPVLGTYQLNNADGAANNLVISLDSANKGIIWIEGLPQAQGRVKAYLRRSPGTYRILPQKLENGKQLPEGTLFLDTASKTVNIALGKAFDETDPTAVFALNAAANTAADVASGADVSNETKTITDDNTKVKTEVKNNGKVKAKAKDLKTGNKTKVVFYTATKTGQTPAGTTTNQ